MKKIYMLCIAALLITGSHSLLAQQTSANITTPKGSTVTAWTVTEMSSSDRAYWDSYWAGPGRTEISYFGDGYSSTQKFNCHGYAWSIAESGPVRWIGWSTTTEEDIYMSDGSYVRVCSETYPGKVSWSLGDHSAITTSTPGRWRSKWNAWPLIEHDKDDTPFGTSGYTYYVSTTISGPADVCNNSPSGTGYSVQSISGATYSWSCSSNLTLSGSGNAITATPSSGATGAAWVEVYISTGCGTATRRKNITLSVTPYVTGGSYTQAAPGFGTLSPTYNVICGYYNNPTITFNVSGTNYLSNAYQSAGSGSSPAWSWSGNDIHFDGFSYSGQWVTFTAVVSNACGTNSYDYTFTQYDCPEQLLATEDQFKVYPNPAIGTTYLEYTPDVKETKANSNNAEYYSVKIYTERGVYVKTIDNKGMYRKVPLDVSNMAPGTYYLFITHKGKTFKKKVMVRR